jgi:hypothetical protein
VSALIAGQTVITDFWVKPIPDRRFDWSAVLDNYDGAEDSYCPVGYGRTEAEAIEDLRSLVED